jgi:hypothetical protein
MAVLALVIYALQQNVELALAHRPWWQATLSTSFVVGLALQLPFACAAYLLARLLGGAADRIARLVGAPVRRRSPAAVFVRRPRPTGVAAAPRPSLRVRPSRGPPRAALV